jgi:hypothetical protein
LIKATPRIAWIAAAIGALLGDLPRQSINPPFCIRDRVNVILQHDLLGRMIKAHRCQPAAISLRPGSNAGIDLPVSQEKSTKVLTRLRQRPCRRRAGSHQVAHRFVGGVRNPNFGEFAGAVQPRRRHSIAPVRFDPVSRLIGISDDGTTAQA